MTSEEKAPGDQDRARGRSKAERRKRTSSLATAGGLANVGVIATYQSGLFNADDLDILECRHEVVKRIRQVHDGNTLHVVGLLMAQALALNSIFAKLAVKAAQVDERDGTHQMESLMRLALKAQSQSRATLEAVLAAGNPPVMFAQQANVAFGPQQVNNGAIPNPRPGHESNPDSERDSERNELLEAGDGGWMEPGTAGGAGRSDSTVEPLAAVNGTAKR